MAKRFIDTNFFKSPFVRRLKGAYKSLYLFIICDCDGSGIWSADFEAASLYIEQKINEAEFIKFFVEKGKAIDLENGRYFMPDFIEHQYPGGLSLNNVAHKNFISELLKFNLLDEKLKPLESPFKGSKVMVKEMVMVKVEEKVMVKTDFLEKFEKPTKGQISDFILEKFPDGNIQGAINFAEKFWNSYENKDWKINKVKMKNWKLAISNWSETLQKDLFPTLQNQPKTIQQDFANSKIGKAMQASQEADFIIDEMVRLKNEKQNESTNSN
jgi:hypothetical protein